MLRASKNKWFLAPVHNGQTRSFGGLRARSPLSPNSGALAFFHANMIKHVLLNVIDNDCDTNADGLPINLAELTSKIHVCKVEPSIIAVTEVKHKNKWDIDMTELSIDG